jgi:hypothetical protein
MRKRSYSSQETLELLNFCLLNIEAWLNRWKWIMADRQEPGTESSAEVIEIAAMHMAYFVASVISKASVRVPKEHRINVFYALSGVALHSAEAVTRDIPKELAKAFLGSV